MYFKRRNCSLKPVMLILVGKKKKDPQDNVHFVFFLDKPMILNPRGLGASSLSFKQVFCCCCCSVAKLCLTLVTSWTAGIIHSSSRQDLKVSDGSLCQWSPSNGIQLTGNQSSVGRVSQTSPGFRERTFS